MIADNRRALALSEQLRKRWNVALSHMDEIASSSNKAQAYDEAFWGAAQDWCEIEPQQYSLANLLFALRRRGKKLSHECVVEGKTLLYADMVDGYLSIHRLQGIDGVTWEEYAYCFERFGTDFIRKIPKYENHAEETRWCAAGMEDETEFGRLCAALKEKKCSSRKRFPDMDGVSLHADLSLDALRIAYDVEGETSPRILVLPAWGLRSWLKGLERPFFAENIDTTLKMLIDNKSTAFVQGEQLVRALPEDVECNRYLHLLLNLLPFRQDIAVRATGWLSSKAFQMVAEPIFNKRFAKVTFTASYQTYSYEQ